MVVIEKKAIFFSAALAAVIFMISANAACDEAVSRKVMENGLVILTRQSPLEDLVAIDVNIKAGSALEEEYAGSGISHFVEHMVFKGTKTRKPGDIEREIKSYGGFMNGAVSQDLTNFTVIVSSKYLKPALACLKDMLLNAAFDEDEFNKEKDVILKEINLDKDDPQRELFRILNENAYIAHPYKYPPIGYSRKFLALKRDDLVNYYNRMYAPNRMVITVAGATLATEAADAAAKEFENFRQPDYRPRGLARQEPVQIGRRDIEEEAPVNLAYLALGFHSTQLLSKDLFAMDVLAMILGRGDNSRLNKALVKTGQFAHAVSAWNYTPADPGLFVINAILDKANLQKAELAIMEEVKKIKDGAVDESELAPAKRMVLADYIFSLQTIEGMAGDTGKSEILTGNRYFSERYVKGIEAVTKEDIKRAANEYLTEDNLTVARVVGRSQEPAEAPAKDAAGAREDKIRKDILSNGLRILAREDSKTATVAITVAMAGGLAAENEKNNGISNFTAQMLLKGTRTRKEGEITGAIERLGGKITPFSGFNAFGLNISILKEDLDFTLTLLQEILTGATFPRDEMEKERSLIIAAIKDEDDDVFRVASNAMRKELFAYAPYSLRSIGEERSIRALTQEDLVTFYDDHCAADNMVISISGEVKAEAVFNKIRGLFDGIRQGKQGPFPARGGRPDKIKKVELTMDKEESVILLGFETVAHDNPDRYALDVLSSVMSGYSGRLFTELRDKAPFAYTLGCVQKELVNTGFMIFYIATVKEKIPEAKKALFEELDKIRTKKVTDEELLLAKRELVTGRRDAMQTNDFFSSNSALDELYGVGYDNLYKYPSEIERVTKDDVSRVADKYLNRNAYAETVVLSR